MAVAIREVLANHEAQQAPVLANKSLISEQLWFRATNRIVKEEGVELALAERILDQALAFLRLVALEPQERYSPSPKVDIGWHTLLMYTRDYFALCSDLGVGYIHHNPFDESGVNYGSGHIARTVSSLKQHGLIVDEQLWDQTLQADCDSGQCASCCDSDGNCGGSL